MELRYRYYFGGGWNPFEKEVSKAYSKLTKECEIKDPKHEKQAEELFPSLDSWPDYVIAESMSTFWEMERNILNSQNDTAQFIEELWRKSVRENRVGEWLKQCDAEESEKAMCFYMANQHRRFNPNDNTVDFRLYFTQSSSGKRVSEISKTYED